MRKLAASLSAAALTLLSGCGSKEMEVSVDTTAWTPEQRRQFEQLQQMREANDRMLEGEYGGGQGASAPGGTPAAAPNP